MFDPVRHGFEGSAAVANVKVAAPTVVPTPTAWSASLTLFALGSAVA